MTSNTEKNSIISFTSLSQGSDDQNGLKVIGMTDEVQISGGLDVESLYMQILWGLTFQEEP